MFTRSLIGLCCFFVAVQPARADWNSLPAVTGGGACRQMAFADATHGYMLAGGNPGVTTNVFVTADGGQTFASVPTAKLPSKKWGSISVVDANVAFVSAIGDGADLQVIAKTIDGGANWTLQTVTTSNPSLGFVELTEVAFVDATTGYAGGEQDPTGTGSPNVAVLYVTTNGGTTWAETNAPPPGNKQLAAVAFTSATTGVGVVNADRGTIRRTTNSGATWLAVSTGTTAIRDGGILFVDALHGYAFTDTQLLVTADGGATWTASSTALPTLGASPSPVGNFLDAQTGLVGSSDGVAPWISRTVDGGASWQSEATPTGWLGGASCVAYASSTVQFAASSDASELRPLKFTTAAMPDAGTGTPDAQPATDAASANPDASGPSETGGGQGCACQAEAGSRGTTTWLLGITVGVVLRRRRSVSVSR